MTRRNFRLSLLLLVAAVVLAATAPRCFAGGPGPELVSVDRIWDQAPHNAFTDLIRYQHKWVVGFREAPEHAGGVKDSHMRVLVSDDGKSWTPATRLSDPRGDIRDAKMAVLPDGRLILLTAIQLFDRSKQTHQSIAYYTRDLKSWEGPVDVGEPSNWMWGIKVHDGVAYSIGYGTGKERYVRLYKSADGVKFEHVFDKFDVPAPFPNENAIHFDKDGTARLLLRCDPRDDDKTAFAFIGSARAPYTDWTLTRANLRVGGPALTRTPDGRLLGAGRLYDPKARMSLFWVDENTGALTECLTFPSGGDCSYPGLVWHDGLLHVSYYSSHEEKKSRIYFARVKFGEGGGAK